MHLVIPFASAASEAAQQAARMLRLPRLDVLLARYAASPAADAPAAGSTAAAAAPDEYSLSPPHERVLAALRGWPLHDGRLPWAAAQAHADGIAHAGSAAGSGWGLLTPSHWHVGAERVNLVDPASLALEETESRALHEALRPLFEELGWGWHWGAPQRWYVSHPSLADTPTASLDRVVGRNVDLWLHAHPQLRLVRRLQAEVQMSLHTHPVNAEREARGLLPVNSFWLSGTGPAPGAEALAPLPADVLVDERLRAPALAEDWPAWIAAWQALDAVILAELLAAAPGNAIRVTLCGERRAQSFVNAPRPWWSALFGARRQPSLPTLLAL